jgi:glutamate formiminotransferase
VDVVSTEFCGLIPLDALIDVCKYYLRVEELDQKKIIEMNL